jgi:transposase-like protein
MVVGVEMPVAGRDYPGTYPALQSWFPDDEACRAYLEKLRWPDGFVCPVCGHDQAWRTKTGLWMCTSCERKTSVTAGTIFHRSRLPLTTWFAAVWFVCSQKNGVSALGLQRVLGFGSYETAWAWMHKLRRAMVRPDRDQLAGIVEVDETIIGGREPVGRRARGFNKAAVAIAVELNQPKGLGRVRLRQLATAPDIGVCDFVSEVVAVGSTVRTDGWNAYNPLAGLGYTHQPVSVVHATEPAHELLPGVHRVASLLKRWLAGTMHHGVAWTHLDYYLDEFTFRFNRRTADKRGLLFYRLLQQAVNTDPHPLGDLKAKPNILG